jgi:LysW-gamma-L-lysine carboxypeptidase
MNTAPALPPTDEQAIALLTELVTTPSPSHHEAEAVACCVRWMHALGLCAQVDGAGSAVGTLGEGPRQIVLLGHIDTAPGWVPVQRNGDLLYGRGSVDAKGPLAAFVVAAARARALDRVQTVVIGAVEEECATSAGARYALTHYHPDYVVIGEPSGWDRVTLGYKGRLLIDYRLTRPMTHTAGQERSACEQAVDAWLRAAAWAAAYNQDKEGVFGALDVSLRNIRSSSDGLSEQVKMTIALRTPPGLDAQPLLDTLAQRPADSDTQVALHTYGHEAPFRADKRTPLVSAFLAAIRAAGSRATLVNKTGTSDMNVVGPVWACPIVAYGPGDSQLDHTPHEHIDLREYLASIRVLTDVLVRLGAMLR